MRGPTDDAVIADFYAFYSDGCIIAGAFDLARPICPLAGDTALKYTIGIGNRQRAAVISNGHNAGQRPGQITAIIGFGLALDGPKAGNLRFGIAWGRGVREVP